MNRYSAFNFNFRQIVMRFADVYPFFLDFGAGAGFIPPPGDEYFISTSLILTGLPQAQCNGDVGEFGALRTMRCRGSRHGATRRRAMRIPI